MDVFRPIWPFLSFLDPGKLDYMALASVAAPLQMPRSGITMAQTALVSSNLMAIVPAIHAQHLLRLQTIIYWIRTFCDKFTTFAASSPLLPQFMVGYRGKRLNGNSSINSRARKRVSIMGLVETIGSHILRLFSF